MATTCVSLCLAKSTNQENSSYSSLCYYRNVSCLSEKCMKYCIILPGSAIIFADASKGSDSEGSDSEGSDSEGSDSEGSDSEGSDSEGSDSEGSDSEGSDSEGSDSEGSDSEGSELA